jgi:SAM-dependent methyltransferase
VGTLSHQEARRIYDRIGAGQDTQAFYEDVATRELIRHGEFASARAVFEFGCGTGRFARTLLRDHLPPTATYRGVDLSPRMVGLAERRLAEFAERARVVLTEEIHPPRASASFRPLRSNYVFDLLSEDGSLRRLGGTPMLRPAAFSVWRACRRVTGRSLAR